ncbi:hypothetical protein KGF54_002786 [Candida jiufengensis]|uniref:uncharacterized protein n=1 Tax=Candida jiufengensis TaxID=497108 RepID=UPI0022256F13|nr:uncharacterized protein KGF54_002786 [Candida jiufengensis]KAI5953414.1 hypothetical protein KGF54_002786 [Candida jiufengensis]
MKKLKQQQQPQQPQQQDSESSEQAPSSSSSHQTLDQIYSPNAKTSSSSTSTTTTTATDQEFVSPTKSLKQFFFKNRLSSYSIESISEEPELETTTKKKTTTTNISNNELTPTRSPRILNFNLRPKFARSRSSGLSDTGSQQSKYPALQNKNITLEDFADTDSSDESRISQEPDHEHEHEHEHEPSHIVDESFSSVLQEYTNRDSESRFIEHDSRPNSKLLTADEKEELMELAEPPQPNYSENEEPLNATPPQHHTSILNQPSPTALNQVANRDSGNSITSLRFKVTDKIEPLKNVNKHISTSTNVDINRSSLRGSLAFSDDSENDNNNSSGQRLPDPNITPLATPKANFFNERNTSSPENNTNTSNISNETPIALAGLMQYSSSENSKNKRLSSKSQLDETLLNNKTTVHTFTFDETMLEPKHQSMARSSMSSGELLRNLENSYEIINNSGNQSNRSSQPQVIHQFKLKAPISSPPQPQSAENNMTAGIDSTNELPIMLYKVHDKDFDESKNRWSVYENRNSNNTMIKGSTSNNSNIPKIEPQQPKSSSSSSSSASYQSINQINQINERSQSQSQSPPIKPEPVLKRDSSLVLSQPKRNIYHSSSYNPNQTPTNLIDLEKQLQQLPYIPRQQLSEKQEENIYKIKNYSNLKYSLLMIIGLILPPIYLLVGIGMFDDHTSNNNNSLSYYGGGLRFYKNYKQNQSQVTIKKFTKWQKILSLVLGIFWILVVLAMIGVGLGIGLTRK